MIIKVLGPGCANCQKLELNVNQALSKLGLEASVEKVTDYSDILAYGVSSTPALVINENVVLAGRVPNPEQLSQLLQSA